MAKKKQYSSKPREQRKEDYGMDRGVNQPTDRMRYGMQKSMIDEDHSKHANLPTEVKIADYAKHAYGETQEYPDALEGADMIMRNDAKGFKKAYKPVKY